MNASNYFCLACNKPLSFNYESTVVRKAIKPPKTTNRWIKLGLIHEECECLIDLEIDPWAKLASD